MSRCLHLVNARFLIAAFVLMLLPATLSAQQNKQGTSGSENQSSSTRDSNSPNTPKGPSASGEEHHAAFEAALKECAAKVGKDENGHPNREEMHACMKEKGFNPPPRHGHHPKPPNSDSTTSNDAEKEHGNSPH